MRLTIGVQGIHYTNPEAVEEQAAAPQALGHAVKQYVLELNIGILSWNSSLRDPRVSADLCIHLQSLPPN